jgi:heat shock protein HtpX
MYIVNPFRQKGRAATDLTSTHPPISERIRILRAMAGGVSYTEYNHAYSQIHHGGGSIIPTSTLAVTGASYRAVSPEDRPPEPDKLTRTRETSDLMWKMGNYKTIDCACGTKLRVPPGYNKSEVKCPHCGRVNPV